MSESEDAQSALRENISRKGSNSYYYAHGKRIDGPAWDGKEEPRLLAVSETPVIPKFNSVEFESFSWLDGTKTVKIFVDFEVADQIEDTDITLTVEEAVLDFRVNKGGKTFVLFVSPLQHPVESATFRKKADKFVLMLKKTDETSWHSLKRSS